MWVEGTRGRSIQRAVQFRRDNGLQHGQRQEVLPVEYHHVGKESDRVPDSRVCLPASRGLGADPWGAVLPEHPQGEPVCI